MKLEDVDRNVVLNFIEERFSPRPYPIEFSLSEINGEISVRQKCSPSSYNNWTFTEEYYNEVMLYMTSVKREENIDKLINDV